MLLALTKAGSGDTTIHLASQRTLAVKGQVGSTSGNEENIYEDFLLYDPTPQYFENHKDTIAHQEL